MSPQLIQKLPAITLLEGMFPELSTNQLKVCVYSGVKPARSHPHHGLPLSFDGTVYFLMAKEIKGFTPEY